MATPASSANAVPVSSSRWERPSDVGGPFSSRGGGRGRGGSRGGRGGGRGAPRGPGPAREGRAEPDKTQPPNSQKPKPVPAASNSTPGAEAENKVPATPRTKAASRRGSRAAVPPISTQVSVQPPEHPTPSSAPHNSNRRRRSQASKPLKVNTKIRENSTEESPLPSVSHSASTPQTESIKDIPPHLANPSVPNETPAMRTNIDALVERVRTVAMSSARPSTPGSHIDWAGDDDDSLPDLDDWGITTSHASLTAQTISPIIVDGLKPLPEPIAGAPNPFETVDNVAPPSTASKHPTSSNPDPSLRPPSGFKTHPSSRSPLSAGLKSSNASRWASETSTRNPPFRDLGHSKGKNISGKVANPVTTTGSSSVAEPGAGSGKTKPSITISENENPREEPSSAREPSIESPETAVTNSTSAPATTRDILFDGIAKEGGLTASIHAPKGGSTDSTSAPAHLSSYANIPKPPLYNNNDNSLHEGRSRHSGRPLSFHGPNKSSRGGFGSNSLNHSRNHSSPVSGNNNRPHHQHARPVITGDAISRLARTIVAATPKSAPAVSTNES